LPPSSFAAGSLRSDSYARPGKLFTASRDLIVAEVATLTPEARQHLIESVVAILRGSNGR
jgi:mRNA interferase MazF